MANPPGVRQIMLSLSLMRQTFHSQTWMPAFQLAKNQVLLITWLSSGVRTLQHDVGPIAQMEPKTDLAEEDTWQTFLQHDTLNHTCRIMDWISNECQSGPTKNQDLKPSENVWGRLKMTVYQKSWCNLTAGRHRTWRYICFRCLIVTQNLFKDMSFHCVQEGTGKLSCSELTIPQCKKHLFLVQLQIFHQGQTLACGFLLVESPEHFHKYSLDCDGPEVSSMCTLSSRQQLWMSIYKRRQEKSSEERTSEPKPLITQGWLLTTAVPIH